MLSGYNNLYWDIESLSNVFTIALYNERAKCGDLFYFLDGDNTLPSENLPAGSGNFNVGSLDPSAKNAIYNQALVDFVRDKIMDANKNILLAEGTKSIRFHDLHTKEANTLLFSLLGSIVKHQDGDKDSEYRRYAHAQGLGIYPLRPIYDPGYDENKADCYFIDGYNSDSYDNTMYALYQTERCKAVALGEETNSGFRVTDYYYVFDETDTTLANRMRQWNDTMFSPEYKERMPSVLNNNERAKAIYDYLKATGRFIDVSKLNEKQSHVGLKAVLGSLGYQMLESSKLSGDDQKTRVDTLEEFIDLLAYNLSDVVNLGELFNSNVYSSNFKLKKQLLETYPELMYQKKPDAYAPDIAPDKVKTGSSRMYIDSSSSKLAAYALCPYGHLDDIEGVSFLYPSARKAKERGIEQIDVLEEANKFLHANFPEGSEAVKAWNKVYEKYSSFRGKNYNDSKEYIEKWGYHEVHSLKGVHPIPIMYYKADGTPSTCFANFSTGGIHGAECNLPLYYEDLHAWQHKQYIHDLFKLRAQHDLAGVGGLGHMPSDQECVMYLVANKITEIADPKDPSIVYSLKEVATYTSKKAKWKALKQPQLFTEVDGKISKRYVYTSVGECEHEDFTSYYPNLLINLEAFYNEQLGYDRYAEIFDLKQKYGKDMKNKELYDELQRKLFSILREGTKLVLNSASGAGDQSFYSPIRMNNMIISMRLIGQLFTWRIGQAQTLEGANIASTNTDGLYAFIQSDFFGHNEDVLARESDVIHVEIEPEPMVLISKDANCRGEFSQKFDILTASGGSLGCWEDPKTTKSLSHPALLDRGLLFYMQYMLRHGISFYEDPDKAVIERIVRDIISDDDLDHVLRLAQNIYKSSRGSMNWNFAYKDRTLSEDNSKFYTYEDLRILDYYVRGYFVSKDAVLSRRIKGLHIAKANGRTIPDKTLAKRIAANETPCVIDPQCREIMKTVGLYDDILAAGNRDMVIEKVTGADPENFIYFDNRSIYNLTDEEKRHIISCLDVNKYVDEIAKTYKSQWQNTRTIESMDLYRAHPTCQAM